MQCKWLVISHFSSSSWHNGLKLYVAERPAFQHLGQDGTEKKRNGQAREGTLQMNQGVLFCKKSDKISRMPGMSFSYRSSYPSIQAWLSIWQMRRPWASLVLLLLLLLPCCSARLGGSSQVEAQISGWVQMGPGIQRPRLAATEPPRVEKLFISPYNVDASAELGLAEDRKLLLKSPPTTPKPGEVPTPPPMQKRATLPGPWLPHDNFSACEGSPAGWEEVSRKGS
eukprot:Skav220364  [mRNA]  locus=scaffold609:99571:101956:+ [translate_table: standard]